MSPVRVVLLFKASQIGPVIPIRANRDSGETILTIQLGGAYDYGSAPDPIYKTLKASDGPVTWSFQGTT